MGFLLVNARHSFQSQSRLLSEKICDSTRGVLAEGTRHEVGVRNEKTLHAELRPAPKQFSAEGLVFPTGKTVEISTSNISEYSFAVRQCTTATFGHI